MGSRKPLSMVSVHRDDWLQKITRLAGIAQSFSVRVISLPTKQVVRVDGNSTEYTE